MARLTTLFLLAGFFQLSAKTFSQGISLNLKNVPITTVFKKIQDQSPYRFVYSSEDIVAAIKVSCSIENASIEKVLDICFRDQPLTFTIDEKFILVKAKEKKEVMVAPGEVRGKITNDKGEPVQGVSIVIKGSNKGTATDNGGIFIFSDIPAGSTLLITSIGYETQEINIGKNTEIHIRLSPLVNGLDEMVVKGYYSTSKKLNTGNVSRITNTEIEKQPVSNPLAAMEGRMSGIFITQSTGTPGSGFTIQIRGQNSLRNSPQNNGNNPLYIVDGVPVTATSLTSSSINFVIDAGNPLNYINPSDIESIEVLKDADATSIYGSRGSNGVILITTKKGKEGRSKINVNFYSGVGKLTRKLDLLNTSQYLVVRHEAFANDGASISPTDYDINGVWDSTRNTDWQKQLLGSTASITDAQASISGGNELTQFLYGSGYHRETTVFPGNFSDKKASVYFNLNHHSAENRFGFTLTGTYVSDNNNILQNDLLYQSVNLAPDAPKPFLADGSLNWENGTWDNPYAQLLKKYKTVSDNLIANSVLSYTLFHGLKLKSNLGYTKITTKESSLSPIASYNPSLGIKQGSAIFANGDLKSWIIEPQLEYSYNSNHMHGSFLLGTSFQENLRTGKTELGSGYNTDALLENISAASRIQVLNNTYSLYKYNAIFGRINISLNDKYIFNFTGRRDGSSRFGPDRRFSNFGAAGAAWIFSKEPFFADKPGVLSFGKLRLSYGVSGNDQIGDYGYLDTYSPTTSAYQNTPGLYPTGLANNNYSWESNRKFESAIELGFLKNRIFISAAFYQNRSSNQLVGYSLPGTAGFTFIQKNLDATVQNTGWEFEINTVNIKNNHLKWSTFINLSIPSNKLIRYPNISGSGYNYIYAVGKPLNIAYAFHYTGVDPKTGIYNFEDVDKNGSIDYPADLQALKTIGPKYYGGIRNSLSFHDFSLDFLFQYVKQTGTSYLAGGLFVPPGMMGNQPTLVLRRWQKPGDISNVQRFTQDYGSDAYQAFSNTVDYAADNLIEDASFIRLKNIYLSYQLPGKCLNRLHLDNLKFYLQGQNLVTITHFSGIDPENYGTGRIPPLKIITAGIQLTF